MRLEEKRELGKLPDCTPCKDAIQLLGVVSVICKFLIYLHLGTGPLIQEPCTLMAGMCSCTRHMEEIVTGPLTSRLAEILKTEQSGCSIAVGTISVAVKMLTPPSHPQPCCCSSEAGRSYSCGVTETLKESTWIWMGQRWCFLFVGKYFSIHESCLVSKHPQAHRRC